MDAVMIMLMKAIRNSEQKLLAKNDSIIASLSNELYKKMAGLSCELHTEINAVQSDLPKAIENSTHTDLRALSALRGLRCGVRKERNDSYLPC